MFLPSHFFAGLWLFIFFLLHADKIVDFISTPVMGGFISGIAVTIILMQIPKLMGSPAGSGELLELAEHIFAAAKKLSAGFPSSWGLVLWC